MNATPNNLINFNSLSLDYLKFITPKIWVLQYITITRTKGWLLVPVGVTNRDKRVFGACKI
jgi:hypothetical protein